MPKFKKDVAPLLDRAVESLTLAIEVFNRPSEVARVHAVVILLQHAFEMLLKATLLQRTGAIHEMGQRYTFGFARCLTMACEELKVITPDEKATLTILDAQRDQAAHFYIEMSEDMLYVHAQAAVTLFDKLLMQEFGIPLSSRIANRVLPISARPPRDLVVLLGAELEAVDALLSSNKRQGAKAAARLRSVMAFTSGARDTEQRVSEAELKSAIARRRRGEEWDVILPEVAQLRLSTDGSGVPISMRITKDAPVAVRIAREGEPVVGTLLRQEVNLWDKFNLSRDDIARKIGVSGPRTHALIYELRIQEDPECYRTLTKGSVTFKGYSKKALDRLREAARTLDVEEVWARHRHRFGAPRKAG